MANGNNSEQEKQFIDEILECIRIGKDEFGYAPTRFIQMCEESGIIGACKRLLANDKLHEGFTFLWEHKRLDLSVEAIALRPDFRGLFSEEELMRAQSKLDSLGYKP